MLFLPFLNLLKMTIECGKGLLGKEACGLLGRRLSEKDNIFKTVETVGRPVASRQWEYKLLRGPHLEGGSPY